MVHTVRSTADFDKQLAAAGKKLVLVDFYATWCGPCKAMDPEVKKISKAYTGKVVVLKVNVDKYDEIASYYKVSSMPTFIFIRNQRKVSGFCGADSVKLNNTVKRLTKDAA